MTRRPRVKTGDNQKRHFFTAERNWHFLAFRERKKRVSRSNSFSRSCLAGFIASRCCVASGQLAKSDAPFWFKVSLSLRSRSRLSRAAITAMHEHINSFCRSWLARGKIEIRRASFRRYLLPFARGGGEEERRIAVFDGCRGISTFSSSPFEIVL